MVRTIYLYPFPVHPQNELQLCALFHMNLSNKEVANIKHTGPGAVRNAKSRLKKKLGLEEVESLEQFLAKV